jgi:signal transduction histidine kinase
MHRPLVVKATAEVFASANADSITQMLVAIIDNANKYAPGDSPITMTVRADTDALIEIGNVGPTIPDDVKAHLFDRFYRADSSRSHKIDGSGIGLAIVARLATLNHGTVSVRDNVPQGAIFTIALPLIR